MEISPEVQGGLIGALLGGIFIFIGFYFRTHTGNKVIIRKLRETSLVSISKLVSDKLSISYNSKPIEKLKLYELELTNEGFIDIENLTVSLEITPDKKTEVIEVQVTDSQLETTIDDLYFLDKCFHINRPYLNMVKKNKNERIGIQIFSDTELKFTITGGNKGWGAFYRKNQKYKIGFPVLFSGFAGMIFIAAKLISGNYVSWSSWLGLIFGIGIVMLIDTIAYLNTRGRK